MGSRAGSSMVFRRAFCPSILMRSTPSTRTHVVPENDFIESLSISHRTVPASFLSSLPMGIAPLSLGPSWTKSGWVPPATRRHSRQVSHGGFSLRQNTAAIVLPAISRLPMPDAPVNSIAPGRVRFSTIRVSIFFCLSWPTISVKLIPKTKTPHNCCYMRPR